MSTDDQALSEEHREELLDSIQRGGATVGESIPESVEIDGTEMNLREFVWETKKQGTVPPDQRDRVREVRSSLKREREQRKDRLAGEPLTVADAEQLADSIVGLDRAIAALKSLRAADFASESREQRLEDNRRWVDFLDNILE